MGGWLLQQSLYLAQLANLRRHHPSHGRTRAGTPEHDPSRYENRNLHCDVLIVGGGVAGLGAALAAARAGARVVLAEHDHILGGQAAWDGTVVEGAPAAAWTAATLEQLGRLPDVRVLTRTTAVGCYDHNVVALHERMQSSRPNAVRECFYVVRAARVVLATGAIEQPLIFSQNDRPGIMLAGAVRHYLRRYGVVPGQRTFIATNNDTAYAVAKDLKEAGARVVGIADTRREVPETLCEGMRALSIAVLPACIPIDTGGFSALRSVTVGQLASCEKAVDSTQSFECDALAVSGGWSPTLHLYAQAGGKLAYDAASGALQPIAQLATMEIVGSAALCGSGSVGPRASPVGDSRRQWVDLLHDVTVADLELALREDYTSVEHVKRYTTVGMAADQGKTSAAATLDVVARLRGIPAGDLGHTTLRPPFTPVTLGAIVGRDSGELFAPSRLLPMHDWHVAHGALMRDSAQWRRPVAYLRSGESRAQASLREARAVRTAAGLLDGSPLGKVEVQGADALDFLDRFYINNLKTLQPGRARYGLMLRESGAIFDDGTVVMLSADHLLITTTSANAGRVSAWLEEWHQCEWPTLRVAITAVTEQWATLSLAGPRARAIVTQLATDIDFSAPAFPHLAMRAGMLLGIPVRVYRVSFTGELTYEINVPANAGPTLWQALLEAGASQGATPLGLDALLQLRLEKGFLHVGTDTDGTTVPDDVGWGKVAANKTQDYIGKRSLSLPENCRAERLQFVGLRGAGSTGLVVGSHLRLARSSHATDGWISSAGMMAVTGEPVALALLRGGRSQTGSDVTVHDEGAVTRARVVRLPFFDPCGDRMNA